MTVVLRVEKLLFKGDIPPGATIVATADLRGITTRQRIRSESPLGLWFLKQQSGGWTIVPARGGDQLEFRDLYYSVRATELETLGADISEDNVLLEVARSLRESNEHPWFIREAIGSYDSSAIRTFWEQALQSGEIRYLVVGLSELPRRGDAGALSHLKEYQTAIKTAPDGLNQLVPQTLQSFFRNAEPDAVQVLGALANDESLDALREAAAHALAAIHTQESLPSLARLLDLMIHVCGRRVLLASVSSPTASEFRIPLMGLR